MTKSKNAVSKHGGVGQIKKALLGAGAVEQPSVYDMARAYSKSMGWVTAANKRIMLNRTMNRIFGIVEVKNPRPSRQPRAPRAPRIALPTGGPAKSVKEEFYKSWEWTTLRMKTLKRFGRVCMCCGDTPANGAILHIDHIKPLSKFWEMRLDGENLQVLCASCNKGKGAWDETDYRPHPPQPKQYNP